MTSTISVSKGVFVFKNGAKAASRKSRQKAKLAEASSPDTLWYSSYKSLWNTIELKIQDLNNKIFSNVLSHLVQYLKETDTDNVSEIPAAALLTGINMPDHVDQFTALKHEIRNHVTPHVAILNAEDCQTLKCLMEMLINGLLNTEKSSNDEESNEEMSKIKKSQCSFSLLRSWYEELYPEPALQRNSSKKQGRNNRKIIVIIPDFEKFSPKIMQDFILITSSYVNVLPFMFVFGVATSLSAVHRSLPCHVSCKVNIQVFHSSPSTIHLNNILESIIFSQDCPFHLGGKVFNLFTDIFLFYDLSVTGFIRNFKYAMLEHFSYGNAIALCKSKKTKYVVAAFSHEDLENVRRLLSFRKLVESEVPEARVKLLTDDEYFRKILRTKVKKIQEYLANLHMVLKTLHILVCDLPNAPLGKQVRELYAVTVSKDITKSEEYQECFKLLSFLSKNELLNKLTKIKNLFINNVNEVTLDAETILAEYLSKLDNIEENEEQKLTFNEQTDRKHLREQLRLISMNKSKNKYNKLRSQILDLFSDLFEAYLPEPTSFPFHEIFFFNDLSLQNHIIGSHRTAVHTALNDPHCYLQCPCCEISNDSIILSSMPDISVVYKLHLECGKMINLYDWLQSFISIVDPQQLEDSAKVDLQLQARFTQAVAELEYLGFIKSSKRKTDHVTRLTWGG